MGGGAGAGDHGGFTSCRSGICLAKPGRFVLGLPRTASAQRLAQPLPGRMTAPGGQWGPIQECTDLEIVLGSGGGSWPRSGSRREAGPPVPGKGRVGREGGPDRHSSALGEPFLTAAAPPDSHWPRDEKARHPPLMVHQGPGQGSRAVCVRGPIESHKSRRRQVSMLLSQ